MTPADQRHERLSRRAMMRRLRPDAYHYQSHHAAILRRSPKPSRPVERFLDCLRRAHGGLEKTA